MKHLYTKLNLARELKPIDFYLKKELQDDEYRNGYIKECVEIANASFENPPSLTRHKINGKEVISLTELKEEIVLRKCHSNIKYVTKKSKSRREIIRELISFLKEGTSYVLYRLDIKSFFESIEKETLFDKLQKSGVDQKSIRIIKNVLELVDHGLPRGIGLSSSLAELYLENFDFNLKTLSNVIYYERFVDDIIIITDGSEVTSAFIREIENKLPSGLNLNKNKQLILPVNRKVKNLPSTIGTFNYLGYKISIKGGEQSSNKDIKDTKDFRDIEVDMSDSKRKKIIYKINKAFLSFLESKNYRLLYDRLYFLASNRNFVRDKGKLSAPGGIYYNYSEINTETGNLIKIDNAMKTILLNQNTRINKKISKILSNKEKKFLLKISFVKGFKNKAFKKYSAERLGRIVECWDV